jgi:hypothetical protein
MTLGRRDQFRIIAVVSGPEKSEGKGVWTECERMARFLNASVRDCLEVRRKIASGLVAKMTASNRVSVNDSQKTLLWTLILIHTIVVCSGHDLAARAFIFQPIIL